MTSALSAILAPSDGDFDAASGEPMPDALERQRQHRRQTLVFAATFHVVNVVLLTLFAAAGTISAAIQLS